MDIINKKPLSQITEDRKRRIDEDNSDIWETIAELGMELADLSAKYDDLSSKYNTLIAKGGV